MLYKFVKTKIDRPRITLLKYFKCNIFTLCSSKIGFMRSNLSIFGHGGDYHYSAVRQFNPIENPIHL